MNNFFEQYYGLLKKKGEIIIRFSVRPGRAKTEAKEALSDNTIKIDIAAPSRENKANKALVKYLAKEFGVPDVNIRIVTGKTGRKKLIKIKK